MVKRILIIYFIFKRILGIYCIFKRRWNIYDIVKKIVIRYFIIKVGKIFIEVKGINGGYFIRRELFLLILYCLVIDIMVDN